jgi:hypothetical protein
MDHPIRNGLLLGGLTGLVVSVVAVGALNLLMR